MPPGLGAGDDLEDAWRDAAALVRYDPNDDDHIFLVRYNGPDDEWLWTAQFERRKSDPPFAPSGLGQTPAAALQALTEAVRHDVGYWPITRPWDEKSTEWAREEDLT